jgi:hypothetical protein
VRAAFDVAVVGFARAVVVNAVVVVVVAVGVGSDWFVFVSLSFSCSRWLFGLTSVVLDG